MADFATEQTFGRFSISDRVAHVVINSNGGSVAIYSIMNDGTEIQIPDSPITNDDAFVIEISGAAYKFVPSGGATYSFSDT